VASDIKFIGGNFKDKWHEYNNKTIQIKWKRHEEKETDVNIAIYIIRDAIQNNADKFILITNDTDIVPAIKMAREENSKIQFKLITPPTFSTHDSLLNAIRPGTFSKLTEGHLKNSLLPEVIKKSNGKIITRPKQYDPK
jgi:hypothetical protein